MPRSLCTHLTPLAGLLLSLSAAAAMPRVSVAQVPAGVPSCEPAAADRPAPPQYCLPLIPGRAAGDARGLVKLTLAASPFGVTVTEDGRYIYDVSIQVIDLKRSPGLTYVVWAITPDLARRRKLGALDADLAARGRVDWNRFMIVVTAETDPGVESWRGPVLFSASSPSGKMQTMAGEDILWNNELPVGTRYCLVNDC